MENEQNTQPAAAPAAPGADLPDIPLDENKPWNMHELIDSLVDEDSCA